MQQFYKDLPRLNILFKATLKTEKLNQRRFSDSLKSIFFV